MMERFGSDPVTRADFSITAIGKGPVAGRITIIAGIATVAGVTGIVITTGTERTARLVVGRSHRVQDL